MFGKFQSGDNDDGKYVEERAMSGTERAFNERECSGTVAQLERERARGSFRPLDMTHVLDGGAKFTARRRWIWNSGDEVDNSGNVFRERSQVVRDHVERFYAVHKRHVARGFMPKGDDVTWMSAVTRNAGALSLHWGAFVSTLASQGTAEQVAEWLPRAYAMSVVGCLAQTELGHGSNVRGLRTTATFDEARQQFVMHSPTLDAAKWWPGGLGLTANFAMVYAQLVVRGQELGFHVFLVQLRDAQHRPMAGVELGEVGPKLGDNGTETGYMRLTHVRIPRAWMMAKNQEVLPNGEYVRRGGGGGGGASDKLQYSTMLSIRAGLVMGAGWKLAQGAVVAVRYSAARRQGFVDPDARQATRFAPELALLDYQVQRQRLLGQVARAYALLFTGKTFGSRFRRLSEGMGRWAASAGVAGGDGGNGGDDGAHQEQQRQEQAAAAAARELFLRELPEMHATSAGLKALATLEVAAGLEECRKCCGGHGVLLASGLAPLTLDYTTYVTAEGDPVVLLLQMARFLVKTWAAAEGESAVPSACSYMQKRANVGGSSVVPPLPATPGCAQARADLSLATQLLAQRARLCVGRAADRLAGERRTSAAAGQPAQHAWNQCAVDLVAAARAHCHYVIARNYCTFLSEAEVLAAPEPVRAALDRLGALHTANCAIQALFDCGATPAQAAQLRAAAERRLLDQLRPDAVALVDAFDFGDNALNSALGRFDGRCYESLYAAAQKSPLNHTPDPVFPVLRPHLDLEFIHEKSQQQSAGLIAAKL